MSPFNPRILIGLTALAGCLTVAAQVASTAPAPSPAPAYNSAFEGYRPFAAGEVQEWRRSNDTVREIGGWCAYAREMGGEPASPATASQPQAQGDLRPPATQQPPKAGGLHEGHHQ